MITTPWTFGDVAAGLNKGAFEDLVEDRALRREQKPDDRGAKQKRRKFGFADGERARSWKRQSGEIGGDESQAEEPARKERERERERERESRQLHEETENGRGLRRKNSSGRSLEKTKLWMAVVWWTMRITCP